MIDYFAIAFFEWVEAAGTPQREVCLVRGDEAGLQVNEIKSLIHARVKRT